MYGEFTVRKRIIKMLFWALAIPDDTNNTWRNITKSCSKVWHLLNLRHLLSDTIWDTTQYWWSYTKTVMCRGFTVRKRIIKMLFWALAIPDDTNNTWRNITKSCSKVWHLLNLRHLLSDTIWDTTQYWWSYTKTVMCREFTVRKRIIKMLFWALAIPGHTRWYWQYLTKRCCILLESLTSAKFETFTFWYNPRHYPLLMILYQDSEVRGIPR